MSEKQIDVACHPMTPYMAQGAAQALEDAAVLARCLERHGVDHPEAASRIYQATRAERVLRIQQTSHGNAWMRQRTDSDWLYAYDACTAPLGG